jgi:hypothetical protein
MAIREAVRKYRGDNPESEAPFDRDALPKRGVSMQQIKRKTGGK